MNNRRRVSTDPHPELAEAVSISRFWRLVDRRAESECWPWLGDVDKDGYGTFFYRGERRRAPEMSLSFTFGERRSPNLDTCHSCDNPICCNPSHLRFDSRQSNVDEMVCRGRMSAGERHPRAVLTDAQVREIRERRSNGATQKHLAAQYGVSEAYISTIVRGLQRISAGGVIETTRNYRKTG